MMETEINQFDYIISIDLGTTFSGSCYSYVGDKERIVHVVKWPEQSENDKFEKTPTACLYRTKNDSPPELIKWGKAAFDYVASNNEPDLLFIDQFKLKLQDIFKQQEISEDQWNNNIYIRAAVDYLREIHKYTCEQLARNIKNANQSQIKYVLTVPATWVNRDSCAMRSIAVKAGIINEISDPPEKLLILSEAHAASLFCEREYCMTKENKSELYLGQRYLICDAGGGTVDLAAYECTTTADNNNGPFSKSDHCQLALESGGSCGSTILDKNMENYLRNEIFFGCIEDDALKNLVDQFVKEIKHYFGGDEPDRNNYMNSTEIHHMSDATESLSIVERESNTITTCSNTKMVDIVENDYDYNQDYETHNCEEDGDDEYYISEDDFDVKVYESDEDEEMFDIDKDKDDVEALSISDYVYFTLPSKGIDPSILENLSLKGSIVNSADNKIKQLRISHQHIAKHIFDPVVVKVIDLIEQQIVKSHTAIHTLFLLGGFGQSPYLYKKLHEEFITNTNNIRHLIVPEDGYRSSMRGGIYYGLDNIDALLTSCRVLIKDEKSTSSAILLKAFKFLVGIDFNISDLSARFSIIETNTHLRNSIIYTESGEFNDNINQLFTFDSEKYDNENEFDFNVIIVDFMQQLFEQIQQTLEQNFSSNWNLYKIRYTVSFSPIQQLDEINNASERIVLTKLSEIEKECQSDNYTISEIMKNEAIWKYVFEAAKHIGMIHPNSNMDVFLNNDRCIYGSLLACNTYLFERNYRTDIFARMFLKMSSFDDITTKFEDYYSNQSQSTIQMLQSLREDCLGVPTVYSFEIKCIGDEEMSILGRITEMTLDIYTADYKEISVVEKKLNYYRLAVSSRQWKKLYQDVIKPQREQFLDLYNDSDSSIPTVEALIHILGIETDFMSVHFRKYLKENVDLSNLQETHSIQDLFINPLNGRVSKILVLPIQNSSIYDLVVKGIYNFAQTRITTETILNELIIPWIKIRLVPAIMEQRQTALIHYSNFKATDWSIIISGEIIETSNNTGIVYDIIKLELENRFEKILWTGNSCSIYHNLDIDNIRHIDSLVHGLAIQEYQTTVIRVTKMRYAIHFAKCSYNSYNNLNEPINSSENGCIQVIDSHEKNLVLYPLLKKNETLNTSKDVVISKFQVKYPCYLSAALYGSEDELEQEHIISNFSFKKLHRFIIPINNPEKPIDISYTIEKSSILFTIKQDEFEGDYRCNDCCMVQNKYVL